MLGILLKVEYFTQRWVFCLKWSILPNIGSFAQSGVFYRMLGLLLKVEYFTQRWVFCLKWSIQC